MKQLTESFIDQTFKSLFAERNAKYGEGWSWRKEHQEESTFLGEIYRGLSVLSKWQSFLKRLQCPRTSDPCPRHRIPR